MLEFLLCSLFTILPDYFFRRYAQGKHWGQEIDFFTVWYELRWGITACALLTVALITLIFYHHPSTSNASPFFRTITVIFINRKSISLWLQTFRISGYTVLGNKGL